ncbi:unnamed protein product, partial [Symbiodinium microadriaticum]
MLFLVVLVELPLLLFVPVLVRVLLMMMMMVVVMKLVTTVVRMTTMMANMMSRMFYRNQFETKTSCGALDPENSTRTGWEQALFGDSYNDAKPFDRCKYGALNVTNDFRGVTSASQYGDSYLVLKDSRLRATFCATDSGGIAGSRLGVCDRYGHVLMEYGDDELNEITRVAVAALPSVDGKAPGHVPKSAWPSVLRITVGYPTLAQRGSGRYVFEVELYGTTYAPQDEVFPTGKMYGLP